MKLPVNSIGIELKEKRKRHGLTMIDVQNATGIAQSYLSQIENDKTRPRFDTVKRIFDGIERAAKQLETGK